MIALLKSLKLKTMRLQLCVPGLLWTHANSTGQKPQALTTPALDNILRFGVTERAHISLTQLQANIIRKPSLLEFAKSQLQIANNTPAFFASPCIQKLEMNSVNLLAGSALAIQKKEAHSICQSLTEFLPDLGWHFYPWLPELWVVTCPKPPQWQTPMITEMMGQVDRSVRPEGEEARLIMRTQAEIQMFLSSHHINVARKEHQMQINGVWFWRDLVSNNDILNTADGIIAADDALLSDDHPLSHSAPYDFAAWEQLCQEFPEAQNQTACIYLDDVLMPSLFADIWGYQDKVNALEQRYFAPIWQALCQGKISELTLLSNGDTGLVTRIKAKAHRAFWKRKITLQQLSS